MSTINGGHLAGTPSPRQSGDTGRIPYCFGLTSANGRNIADDAVFCEALLYEEGVALVPGRAFGLPGFFRLSYAYDVKSLTRACDAITRFCQALK